MKEESIYGEQIFRYYATVFLVFLVLSLPAYSQDTEQTKEPEPGAGGTSVKLSQEVMNPTTLAWQLQLEEYAIFKTENQDGFAQNFRFSRYYSSERRFFDQSAAIDKSYCVCKHSTRWENWFGRCCT